MEISANEDGDLVVVALKGEIDLEYSGQVREALLEAVGKARGVIYVRGLDDRQFGRRQPA